MNKKQQVANHLLFELIDKIARFYIHIEQIQKEFYNDTDNAVQDKSLFIGSFKKALCKFILLSKILQDNINSDNDVDSVISRIRHYLRSINLLHEQYLIDLPRPAEPLELKRFWRVIKKQAVTLEEDKDIDISIFINEEVGESAYPYDPIDTYNSGMLNDIITDINEYIENGFFNGQKIEPVNVKQERENYKTFHITIPRIDTNNPCKWPCLVHELSHHLYKTYYSEQTIEKDFLSSLSQQEKDELQDIFGEIELNSWLTESWCDLFASVLMGPSFLFSQYSAFLNDFSHDKKNYPPILFRYRLIFHVLQHRFDKDLISKLEDINNICDSTLKALDSFNSCKSSDLHVRQLFQYFELYFLDHFFIKDEKGPAIKPVELNDKLKKLVGKYIDNLEWETIECLVESLKQKLPIPSKNVNGNIFKQQPTTVQEIFLSGCIYRNSFFKENILKKFEKIEYQSEEKIEKEFLITVIEEFKKFDQSILRSIQVSEWFYLYYDVESQPDQIEVDDNQDFSSKNLLNDYQIKNLIAKKDDTSIKIIPIINFEKQLGTTSFDIRLGTSFEVYHTNQYGIIDFTDEHTTKETSFNSSRIDKDFLESLTIMPGQFILGHSMEYLKLPDNMSADLEGRSSFARLGIEIHMTAGFVDPGFEGVLTFEIYNAGPTPVKLFPGLRVAQLRFMPIDKPSKTYGNRHGAKYKGLLEHHISKQSKDYEIKKLKQAIERANEVEQKKLKNRNDL